MTWTRVNKNWCGEEIVDKRKIRRIRQPKYKSKLSAAALERVRVHIQAHRQGVHVGVILGVNLAADHCKFNAGQHSTEDRQWHADALHDESDDLRDYAKTLNTPEDYGRTQEDHAKVLKSNGHE